MSEQRHNYWTTLSTREESNAHHGLHTAQSPVSVDYLSFTWCPEELATHKKLAAIKKREGIYRNFAEYIKAEIHPTEVDLLDSEIRIKLLDFLTYTSKSFFWSAEEVADAWDETLTVWERPSGMFGYRYSWDIFVNGQKIGVAATGAKNGGCYVSFTGLGMSMIDPVRLHTAIYGFPSIRLTRVDIALDDYAGIYTVDRMRELYIDGEFSTGGQYPSYQYIEGGKLHRNKMVPCKGRSFYVGGREGGKLLRSYEKGKQLGSEESPWVRHEVEIRSSNREIPLWVLLRPTEVFAGAYKCLSFVNEFIDQSDDVEQIKLKCKKSEVKATYERSVKNLQRVGGALINVMRNARGFSDEQIVEMLIGSESDVPRALRQKAVSIAPKQFDHTRLLRGKSNANQAH
jgi:DNA relaxase NicK